MLMARCVSPASSRAVSLAREAMHVDGGFGRQHVGLLYQVKPCRIISVQHKNKMASEDTRPRTVAFLRSHSGRRSSSSIRKRASMVIHEDRIGDVLPCRYCFS